MALLSWLSRQLKVRETYVSWMLGFCQSFYKGLLVLALD